MSNPKPCDTCPKKLACNLCSNQKPGCIEWQNWFAEAWAEFNAYAKKYGVEIKEECKSANHAESGEG